MLPLQAAGGRHPHHHHGAALRRRGGGLTIGEQRSGARKDVTMSLNARIARLEDGDRHRQQRCRWCTGVVIYPATSPRWCDGQIVPLSCENPSLCPGPARARIYLPERRTAILT